MDYWFNLANEILFWAFNGGIVLFSFLQWLKLKRNTNIITKELEEANKFFSRENPSAHFAQNFQKINEAILKKETLSHSWHVFTEHLMFPTPADKDQAFMNSLMPSSFFSSESVISQRLDLRWVNSVPGKITALGILGTFAGLSLGVYFAQGKLTGDLDEVQAGLKILLEGASLAFVTSFLGIIGSLFYSYQEKKRFKAIDNAVGIFCDNLEKSLKFVTNEQVGRQLLYIQSEQLKTLESFSNDLAINLGNSLQEKFSSPIGNGLERIISSLTSLKDVQTNFGNDLMKNLADKITGGLTSAADEKKNDALESLKFMQDSMIKQMDRMLVAQTQMQDSTKKLIDEISSSLIMSQGALSNDLVSTVGKLQTDFGSLATTLTTKIDESVSGMTSKMSLINEEMTQAQTRSLKAFDEVMRTMSENLSQASETSSGRMVDNIDRSAVRISELVESLSRVVDHSSEKTITGIDSVMTNLNKSVDRFGANVIDMNKYVEKQKDVLSLNDKMVDSFREIVSNNREVGEKFSNTTSSLNSTANNLGTLNTVLSNYNASVSSSISTIRDVNSATQQHWAEYTSRYQNIDSSVAEMFNKLDSGTKDYSNLISSYMSQLTQSSQQVVGQFSTAVTELSEAIEDLADHNTKKTIK